MFSHVGKYYRFPKEKKTAVMTQWLDCPYSQNQIKKKRWEVIDVTMVL